MKTKIVRSHTADSKPVKQEVNCTVILPPLVFPGRNIKVYHQRNVGILGRRLPRQQRLEDAPVAVVSVNVDIDDRPGINVIKLFSSKEAN